MIHRLSIDGSQRILPKEFRILPGPGLEEIASFIVQLKAFNCVRLPYSCPVGWLGWLVQWWSFWPLYRTYIGHRIKTDQREETMSAFSTVRCFCRGRSQAPFRRCLGILAAGYQGFDLFFHGALEPWYHQGVVGVCWGHHCCWSITFQATFENVINRYMFIDRTARSGCLVSPP